MRPSRRQVQGVRLRDHQGRDGPRRRSLLRVLAVGLRTFWKLTNSKDFLSCTLLPFLGAPRPVRCRPYTAACGAPQWRGTSAERRVEVALGRDHRWRAASDPTGPLREHAARSRAGQPEAAEQSKARTLRQTLDVWTESGVRDVRFTLPAQLL